MISDSGLQSPAAPVIDQELGGRAPMTDRAVLAPGVPLCVDLDGTLVKSDTLVDSVLALARQKPAEILRIPSWIAQGKAQFKKLVTASVTLDVEHLPYNRPLLEWLRAEHGAGRAIYLATAADRPLAERVADYLGIFAGVLASDGDDESRGEEQAGGVSRTLRRAVLLHRQCASRMWSCCAPARVPMTANPHRALTAGLRRAGTVPAANFEDRGPTLKSWLRACGCTSGRRMC